MCEKREVKDIWKDSDATKILDEFGLEEFPIEIIVKQLDKELIEQISNKANNSQIETVIWTNLAIERLLLELLIMADKEFSERYSKLSYFEIINESYIKDLIYKDQAILYHKLRVIRNICGHNLSFELSLDSEKYANIVGEALVSILEIKERLNKKV